MEGQRVAKGYQGNSGQKNDTFYWLIALGLIFTGIAAPL